MTLCCLKEAEKIDDDDGFKLVLNKRTKANTKVTVAYLNPYAPRSSRIEVGNRSGGEVAVKGITVAAAKEKLREVKFA